MSPTVCVLESIETEKKVVRRLQAEDEDAFKELLACCGRRFFNYAYRLTWNRADAEDLMQETLLHLVRGIRDYRGDSRLLTWIFRINTNQFLLSRRRKAGEPQPAQIQSMGGRSNAAIEPPFLQAAGKCADPFSYVLAEERRFLLRQAVERLPIEERKVLILRDIEGVSAEKTAKSLGLSIPAVKSRLHRARLKLRKEFTRAFKEGNNHSG